MPDLVGVWDNHSLLSSFDRYTVLISDREELDVYGMSGDAMEPQGFNQYLFSVKKGWKTEHLGKEVPYHKLPYQVKLAIDKRLESYK